MEINSKPITLAEAECYDRAAYEVTLDIAREARISKTISAINELICIHLDKIKERQITFDMDLPCYWGEEWSYVIDQFEKNGFAVGYYPPHQLLSIDLKAVTPAR